MFVFGDPVDNAKILLDTVMNEPGPTVPDIHYDEMSEQDLRNLNAYLHAALTHALRHDLGDDLAAVLTEWYDEAFTALAAVSRRFRERFAEGAVYPPGGPGVHAKYLAIIEDASES